MFDDVDEADIEASEASETTFQRFIKSLPPRLSDENLSLLWILVRKGDPTAFNRLWLQTARLTVRVYFSLLTIVPPWVDPMDLIQDGLIAARTALETWDPDRGALSTHVTPRIRGAMLDTLRREFRGKDDISLGAPGDLEAMMDPEERLTELLVDESVDLEWMADLRVLRRAINRLPYKERLLLIDRIYYDMDPNSIAQDRNLSAERIRRRLRRVMRKLRMHEMVG